MMASASWLDLSGEEYPLVRGAKYKSKLYGAESQSSAFLAVF